MLEESKGWLFIVLLGTLVGLGYTAHYLSSVDTANAMLQESKTKLAEMHEVLSLRRTNWDKTESIRLKTLEAMEQNKALLQAKDVLDTRFHTLEDNVKSAVETMKTAVGKMRGSAPGTDLGDITLASGQVLHGTKIRKVEESGFSLIHADGIGTFAPELLPVNLTENYDLGPHSLLLQLEQLAANLNDSTPLTTARNNLESTDAKRGESSLQRAIETTTLRVAKEEKKVIELDREVKDAESKKLPSFNLRTMRDIAEGNAGQARNELKKLKAALERLKTKEKRPSK